MFGQSQIQIDMLCLQTSTHKASQKQPQGHPLIIITSCHSFGPLPCARHCYKFVHRHNPPNQPCDIGAISDIV